MHLWILVLLCGLCSLCVGKDKAHALDHSLLLNSDAWFESLSEQELREHWSEVDSVSLAERRRQVARLDLEVLVNIKLVGFNEPPFDQAKTDLLRFLDNSPITRFQTAHTIRATGQQSHDLPVRTNFVFSVDLAPPSLQQTLAKAIESYAGQHKLIEGVHPIDPEVVDQLLRADFERGLPKYTIYVLNLPSLRIGGSENYTYVARTEQVEGLFSLDAPVSCPTTHWVSRAGRWAWLDLTAGPIWYGPHSSGEGFVSSDHTLPSLRRVWNSVSASKSVVRARVHEFFASLAAFVHVTCEQLIVPPLQRFPVPWRNFTVVDVTFIHDTDDKTRVSRTESVWGPALQQLRELKVGGQNVEVRIRHVELQECEECAVGLARALRITSSAVAIQGLRTPIREYLSSEMLVQALRNRPAAPNVPEVAHRIPVYVYNLGQEHTILIDRTLQATTVGEVVVAVQSEGERVAYDAECNSQRLEFDPRTAARAALAAVLQALGLAATHEMWNEHSQKVETNYLWSLGRTPFGEYSTDTSLSFAQQDAASRNVLVSEISSALLGLQEVLHEFSQFELELEDALSSQSYTTFMRRWNLIRFKLEKVQRNAALMDYPKALVYARSIAHDCEGIKALVVDAQLSARYGGKVVVRQSKLTRGSLSWAHLLEIVACTTFLLVCALSLMNPSNRAALYIRALVMKEKKL